MNMKEITSTVSGLLTVEYMSKKALFKTCTELGIKPIQVNKALKELSGFVDVVERDGGVFVRLSPKTEEGGETVTELKRTPEARERRVLRITEEQAKDLSLLNLRTPPVKEDLVYPEGVTKEMFEEFKQKILENKDLIWDLVSNFNGAKQIAITMWEPENPKANEDGRVFYRWDEPENSWDLMTQLCTIVDLYNEQEAQVAEE
jgi:hypothetical protein